MCPVGIPQHVIQRGNNRQVCFTGEQNFTAYADWLNAYSKKYQVDIHAWVLMIRSRTLVHYPKPPALAGGLLRKQSFAISSHQSKKSKELNPSICHFLSVVNDLFPLSLYIKVSIAT